MAVKAERQGVVLTAAHPDDVANAMGGTAYLLKDRFKLHVLCMTKGERGIAGRTHEETAAIREAEERAACDLIGAGVEFMGEVDGEVFASRELCRRIADVFERLRPVAVFTLWPVNEHVDHSATYQATMRALSLAGMQGSVEVYMMENAPGVQTNQFEPDICVDISGAVERKRELLRCHASQNVGEEGVEGVLRRNVFRGLLARCDYAEPFKTLRPLTVSPGRAQPAGVLRGLA